jgi:hypothetical protein
MCGCRRNCGRDRCGKNGLGHVVAAGAALDVCPHTGYCELDAEGEEGVVGLGHGGGGVDGGVDGGFYVKRWMDGFCFCFGICF